MQSNNKDRITTYLKRFRRTPVIVIFLEVWKVDSRGLADWNCKYNCLQPNANSTDVVYLSRTRLWNYAYVLKVYWEIVKDINLVLISRSRVFSSVDSFLLWNNTDINSLVMHWVVLLIQVNTNKYFTRFTVIILFI